MSNYLSGNSVRFLVSDMFGTYTDTRLIAPFRDEHGILLSVMPPYMHWMNHMVEDMIQRTGSMVRVRLPGLVGKVVNNKAIMDAAIFWPYAHEHANQCQVLWLSGCASYECITGSKISDPVQMHPFGTVAYMHVEPRYRINRQSDVAEKTFHLFNGALIFVCPGADVPRADLLLRKNGQVIRSEKTTYPHLKLGEEVAIDEAMNSGGGESNYNPVALGSEMS